ncbi:MAG: hypothetical protein GY928_11165 [Colwellia sp.]|nr:hypothetical protein [Colwellia sp.]
MIKIIIICLLLAGCANTDKRWTKDNPLEVTPTTDNITIEDSVEIEIIWID